MAVSAVVVQVDPDAVDGGVHDGGTQYDATGDAECLDEGQGDHGFMIVICCNDSPAQAL